MDDLFDPKSIPELEPGCFLLIKEIEKGVRLIFYSRNNQACTRGCKRFSEIPILKEFSFEEKPEDLISIIEKKIGFRLKEIKGNGNLGKYKLV